MSTTIQIPREQLEALLASKREMENSLKELVEAFGLIGAEVEKLSSGGTGQIMGLLTKPGKVQNLLTTITHKIVPIAQRWEPYFAAQAQSPTPETNENAG